MLWRRKTKEEKVLEKMKEKKAQLDKLKEEIAQMGKLILKDGKLQKVEDTPVEKTQQANSAVKDLPPMPPPIVNENMVEAMRQELNQMRLKQMYKQPTQQEQIMQEQMRRQEQMNQQPFQQPQMAPQYQYQQQFQPQQPIIQQPQQQFRQPLPPTVVSITLINGEMLQVQVQTERLEDFINQINTAIDNQSSLPLGNRVINGRNIITYIYE